MRADVFAAVAADDSAFSGTRLPQLVPQTGSQSAASQQQTQLTVAHDNAAETRRSQTNSGAWAGGGGGGNASGGGPSSAATHRTAASARSRVGTGKRGAAARPSGAGPIVRVFSRKELDLLRASEAGDIDEVYRLLWDGADVNCKMPCSGSTPLMLACQSGHAKIASVLLEFGALAKTPDEYSATSLHWAANSGSSQLVSLIVGRGRLSNADVSKKDAFGSTALHFASVRNLSGSVMALVCLSCAPVPFYLVVKRSEPDLC
ncbi:ankyrin repeat-containing domain protein [Entophlyctis helioformis]|nr:ankyrin repeat-containing domain protein [Entophlyctis helioformis]